MKRVWAVNAKLNYKPFYALIPVKRLTSRFLSYRIALQKWKGVAVNVGKEAREEAENRIAGRERPIRRQPR
jgi:hypothetical protein